MKYEVSPPDWTRPLCRFEAADMPLTAPSTPAFDQVAEIFGVLEGDHAVSRLSNLDSSHGYVIRCDRLVRCDAAATAALVRWADGINRSGHQAVFKNVHRLMQTYFAAQGLTEHAKVTVRKD
jgi:ABC-type transporter Mla MlaB component